MLRFPPNVAFPSRPCQMQCPNFNWAMKTLEKVWKIRGMRVLKPLDNIFHRKKKLQNRLSPALRDILDQDSKTTLRKGEGWQKVGFAFFALQDPKPTAQRRSQLTTPIYSGPQVVCEYQPLPQLVFKKTLSLFLSMGDSLLRNYIVFPCFGLPCCCSLLFKNSQSS